MQHGGSNADCAEVPVIIALAPMEGVIDSILRELLTKDGGIDQCTTEFIRVTDRELPDHVFFRYCPELRHGGRTKSGVPVYVQLLGSLPEFLATNAARAVELGAPGIDLNFGCPAKTVNRHDGGATLLKDPSRIFKVVSAVRTAVPTPIPVTAKVRLGFADQSLSVEIAQAAADGGASVLTVHARTRNEGYEPPAHWDAIARMRAGITIPVVANGDIWSRADYLECLRQSGCSDIAVGRPVLSCPNLPLILKSAHPIDPLPWDKILAEWFKPFLQSCATQVSDAFALARGKQWLRQLTRQYPEASAAFVRARSASTLAEFISRLIEP